MKWRAWRRYAGAANRRRRFRIVAVIVTIIAILNRRILCMGEAMHRMGGERARQSSLGQEGSLGGRSRS